MILLGLDPGLRITGWGVIESNGNRLSHIAHGVIKSTASDDLPTRLVQLHDGLREVLTLWQPQGAAVEQTFVNKNPDSTLKLGQARGVVLLVPALHGIPVAEYSANHIKKAIVGVGHAAKDQVHDMVSRLLPTAKHMTADAADALAIAICHAHHMQSARAGMR